MYFKVNKFELKLNVDSLSVDQVNDGLMNTVQQSDDLNFCNQGNLTEGEGSVQLTSLY